jgi:F0F1-type ATP synthase membrane subunit b/b'
MTTTTKTDELAAMRELADRLGPDSYLGPWLLDAIDYLAADIRADIIPTSARAHWQAATDWRIETEAACRAMRDEARTALDKAHATADRLVAEARAKAEEQADRARERMAAAIRRAEREVWA